jgi:hypothetical protein
LLQSVTQVDSLNAANNTTDLHLRQRRAVIKTQQSSLAGIASSTIPSTTQPGIWSQRVWSGERHTPATVAAARALFDPKDPDKNRVTT